MEHYLKLYEFYFIFLVSFFLILAFWLFNRKSIKSVGYLLFFMMQVLHMVFILKNSHYKNSNKNKRNKIKTWNPTSTIFISIILIYVISVLFLLTNKLILSSWDHWILAFKNKRYVVFQNNIYSMILSVYS